MKRIYLFISIILFALVVHPQAETSAAPGQETAVSAAAIFQQVNQFRIDNGLAPFQANSALSAAAQNQANYMAEYMVFSNHTGYGGSTPLSRAQAAGYNGSVSENIVGGTGMSARQGLIWWTNSPVHYRTLVTTRYVEAGTGYASNGSENFFVLVVGVPPGSGVSQTPVDESPAPLFVTPIVKAQPAEDGSITHVVQDGQALWSLAAHYEVPLTQLLLYNGLAQDAFLQPGDAIIIELAEGADPPPTPTPATTHTVREGESIWSIAALYDVRFADLLWFNGLTEDSFLQPGQVLRIRLGEGEAPPPTPTPIVHHAVSSGQTLWDIALTYGLTLDDLLALNPTLTADSLIQIGDAIQVRALPPTPLPTQPATAVPPTTTPAPLPTAAPTQPPAPAAAMAQAPPPSSPTPPAAAPVAARSSNLGRTLSLGALLLAAGLVIAGGMVLAAARRQGRDLPE